MHIFLKFCLLVDHVPKSPHCSTAILPTTLVNTVAWLYLFFVFTGIVLPIWETIAKAHNLSDYSKFPEDMNSTRKHWPLIHRVLNLSPQSSSPCSFYQFQPVFQSSSGKCPFYSVLHRPTCKTSKSQIMSTLFLYWRLDCSLVKAVYSLLIKELSKFSLLSSKGYEIIWMEMMFNFYSSIYTQKYVLKE